MWARRRTSRSGCRATPGLMGHTNRIARMIALTVEMEIITTASEAEALLLEANLIKKLKPRYNINFRDDKSFPYILISREHRVSQVVKHRGARNRDGDYFGPFASAGAVNRTINALQRAFLIRSCSDSVYESRTRPCLLYQIKRCSAPCTGELSEAGPRATGLRSARFPQRQERQGQGSPCAPDGRAAEALDFEQAAIYRDRISALSHVQGHQGINPADGDEADVFRAWPCRADSSAYRCSFSGPGRTGATGRSSRAPTRAIPKARCWRPFSPSSMTTSRVRNRYCSATRSRRGACCRMRLSIKSDRRVAVSGAQARREARTGRTCAEQRARGPGPAHGGIRLAAKAAGRGGGELRSGPAAASGSRSMTTATFRAAIRWAA